MTDKVGRGKNGFVRDSDFIDGAGDLTNAAPVTIDLIDPDNIEVVSNASPTSNPSTGHYTYVYNIASNAKLGIWTIRWEGVINGSAVSNTENYEVVLAGTVIFDDLSFATVGELQTYLAQGTIDEAKAELALAGATAAIQAECQHRIFRIEDDTKKLRGTWRSVLQLPEPPVEEVSTVTVTLAGVDEVLSDGGFHFTRAGLLYRESSALIANQETYGYWGGVKGEVEVTYTHGYSEVPGELKDLCLQVAARSFSSTSGVEREDIGVYSVSYGSADQPELSESEKRICRKYRTPLP